MESDMAPPGGLPVPLQIGFPRYHRHSQLTESTFPHTCWMGQIWGPV